MQMWEIASQNDDTSASIGFDHFEAGQKMADILVDKGYKHLIFVSPYSLGDFRAHERAKGFTARAKSLGATVSNHTASQEEPMAAGRAALSKVAAGLDKHQGKTAMAFANDNLAVGAMLCAIQMGLAIPDDIGLLGFGDFEIAQHIGSGLTTLAAPRYQIGYQTGLKILEKLGLPPPKARTVALNPELMPKLVERSTLKNHSYTNLVLI
jgi:LacI family gluconate utilization system Gnt-I transcriptional repressor